MANSTLADTARKDILTTSTLSAGGPSEASPGDGAVTHAPAQVPFGPPAGDGVLAHAVSQPPFGPPAGDGAPVLATEAASPAVGQAPIATPADDSVATHAAAPADTVDVSALLSSLAIAPYQVR